ncbi:MAG: sodium:calcium antiporter [Planctomycetota bacterium]
MSIIIPLALILLTCLVIWRACDGFEIASEYLGRNLSEGVRGGTINAISSSIPELLTTVIALCFLADEDGFAMGLGTTAGSALFNGMVIPSACILAVIGSVIAGHRVTSVDVSSKVIWRDGVALVACEIAVYFLLSRTELDWWQGLVLMLMYLAYLAYMLLSMKRPVESPDPAEEDESENNCKSEVTSPTGAIHGLIYWLSFGPLLDLDRAFVRPKHQQRMVSETWNAFPLLITATSVIGAACYVLVMACETLGREINMPSIFVAVIFASMATSVPDTVMSIRDARDGDYDDAVANALGSNLFNIGFALGFPLFLYTLISGPITLEDQVRRHTAQILLILLILTALGFLAYLFGGRGTKDDGTRFIRMTRTNALMLLGLYGFFMAYVVGTVAEWDWAVAISAALTFN